jgi:DNA uptake protein ComE-like DNA-binding protein
MKQFIRDYFTFDRRHRNGVFVVLFILILLLLYLSFADLFFTEEKMDFSQFEKEVAAFEAAVKNANDSAAAARKNCFLGNTLLSDSNDGDENEKRTQKFQRHERKYARTKNYSGKNEKLMVEINSADTALLKELKGIGSMFAKRIVKFRNALGGFVKKEQLLEVYGLDKEKYEIIAPQIEIDSSLVKKININSASVETLAKHPYINKRVAAKIYWHRTQHGNYSNLQDILKLNLVDEETFSKLEPYLKVKE